MKDLGEVKVVPTKHHEAPEPMPVSLLRPARQVTKPADLRRWLSQLQLGIGQEFPRGIKRSGHCRISRFSNAPEDFIKSLLDKP